MKPEIKALWVAALQSGDYPQGRGKLRTNEGYCCLGVLCDLYRKAFPEEAMWREDGSSFIFLTKEIERQPRHNTSYLPEVVVQWAGLREDNPVIKDASLAQLNDRPVPFRVIAAMIDSDL